MRERATFLAVYAVGIGVAVGAFMLGGVVGFIICGMVCALLFEAAKPRELLENGRPEAVEFKLEASSRQTRATVWHAALAFLRDGGHDQSGGNEERYIFEQEMYLLALARLHELGIIDAEFAANSVSLPMQPDDKSVEAHRLQNLFILSLYRERLPDFFGPIDDLKFQERDMYAGH